MFVFYVHETARVIYMLIYCPCISYESIQSSVKSNLATGHTTTIQIAWKVPSSVAGQWQHAEQCWRQKCPFCEGYGEFVCPYNTRLCGATWVCSQNRILIGSVIFAQFIIATGVLLEGKETKLRDVLQRDLCCFIDHTSMTTIRLLPWVRLHTTTCRTGLTPGWGHFPRCRSCPPPGPISALPVSYIIIPNTQTMLCVPL